MSDWRRAAGPVALAMGFVLIGATRLPLLASPHLVLDGDEAIVGLMAKHMTEGRGWPLYFEGQSFGLSIVETVAGAVAFRIAGPSTEALKLSMLALWSAGWALFVLAVRRWCDSPTAIVAGLLLATCPAWGNWSMMARGYHVGGFVTAQAALWWLARVRDGPAHASVRLTVAGILLTLLALTQALWLVALLPFVALTLWERRRPTGDFAGLAAGLGIALLLNAFVLSRGQTSYWSPSYLSWTDLLGAPGRLARGVWTCLGGAYYYNTRLPAGLFDVASSALWFVLSAAAVGWLLVARTPGLGRRLRLTVAAAIASVLAAAALLAPSEFAYRHLLPVPVLLALSVAVALVAASRRGGAMRLAAWTVLALLASTGVAAILEVPRLWVTRPAIAGTPERADLDALVLALQEHGMRHVYSLDGMFQWNLMFTSDERISARWITTDDRRPEIPREVDSALWSGRPTALVGNTGQLPRVLKRLVDSGQSTDTPHVIGQSYFWIERPSAAALTTLGFQLHPQPATTGQAPKNLPRLEVPELPRLGVDKETTPVAP